jgi:hypothetical protein
MDRDDEIGRVLREIRDVQREQLVEYRSVMESSIEIQQRAVAQQEELRRLYRRLVLVGGSLVAVLMALLVYLVLIYYLLAGWSTYLFGV